MHRSARGRCSAYPRGVRAHMSPGREMPHLTLRRPRGVYILCNALEIQKPPAGSTTRACTGPTRPYYNARNQGLRTVRAMLNADPLLRPSPSSLPQTSPTASFVTSYCRHAADARSGRRMPCTACLTSHVTRSSSHVVAALDEPHQASSALRSPVSLEGLTPGLEGGGGGGAVPQPPGLCLGVVTGARRCRALPSRNARGVSGERFSYCCLDGCIIPHVF
ncbi:hypothetical protein BGY98DRAFT_336661 [Russula aff. rugulosa BPL654]|nr:hypothetical protein BGY98DRAFT_336661 [Russula aff. rugulosa BPL654]